MKTTNRPTRWATRGAPGASSYAACFIGGKTAKVLTHIHIPVLVLR